MMDADLNVTYLNFVGHVDLRKYRYLYFVVMFIAYILIICSNFTIIYLIWIHRNLHEPMYIFIGALSVNSVLFSTAIYPKLLIDFLSEMQTISYSGCLLQWLIYYSLGSSDFLLLTAMAYDRYVSICKPLQYPTIMRKSTVGLFLAVAWLVPLVELKVVVAIYSHKKLCSFTLRGLFCNGSALRLQCTPSKFLSVFGLVNMVHTILFPVLFILFTYTKIVIVVLQSCRKVWKKAVETCLPHLLVLLCFSCFASYDVISTRVDSDLPKTVHFIMTIQVILFNPLFNPIIYGLKMKEISKHLKRMFYRGKLN